MNGIDRLCGEGCTEGLAHVAGQLAGLAAMTVNALRERFEDVYGFPTNSRNKDSLRKRIAWKIQADADGGLSERALARIEELAPLAPVRWKRAQEPIPVGPADTATQVGPVGDAIPEERPHPAPRRPAPPVLKRPSRDPRLPKAGTILTRAHQGISHEIRVMEKGFLYDGKHFLSLSKVAREITGTHWNGFLFFKEALEAASAAAE